MQAATSGKNQYYDGEGRTLTNIVQLLYEFPAFKLTSYQ